MKISCMLLKPDMKKLETELGRLRDSLRDYTHEEVLEIRDFVRDQENQFSGLQQAFGSLEGAFHGTVSASESSSQSVSEQFREVKMNVRLARRRFKKFLSNQSRIRKMKERRAHVGTYAA